MLIYLPGHFPFNFYSMTNRKRKRGRPTTGGPEPFIGLRLPAKLLAHVDRVAEREKVDRSKLIRRFIVQGLVAGERTNNGRYPLIPIFGSKFRLAARYPPPLFDTIVEPFAGGASYSIRVADGRNVVLVEKNESIAAMWRFVLAAAQSDILSLPLVRTTESLDDSKFRSLSLGEKCLIGFWLAKGRPTPANVPSSWLRDYPDRLWGREIRNRIANMLPIFRNWRIIEGDYTKAPKIEATFFVDPPYERTGDRYQPGAKDLDFERLREWCGRQKGQVIVCESFGSTWLSGLKPLGKLSAIGGHAGGKRVNIERFRELNQWT